MEGTSAQSGQDQELTPMEAAVLHLDNQLQMSLAIVQEQSNTLKLLETSIKLQIAEVREMKSILKQKE